MTHASAVSWWSRFLAPWRAAPLVQAAVTTHIPAQLNRMEGLMADNSALLNEVADGLTTLGQPVADLIAERDALAAENAQLKGEDAAESDAAARVKAAYDDLAGKFRAEPDVPDVDPLPEPQTPTEPTPEA